MRMGWGAVVFSVAMGASEALGLLCWLWRGCILGKGRPPVKMGGAPGRRCKPVAEKKKNPRPKCPNCGRGMKQQFIGLRHCKCGTSWQRGVGYFERTPDMMFALERKVIKKGKNSVRTKQVPVIRRNSGE